MEFPRLETASPPDTRLSTVETPQVPSALNKYNSYFGTSYLSSYWENSPSRLYRWIEDARHAPALIILGKGRTFDCDNPILQIPMTLISAVWIIQAFNITLSSLMKVTFGASFSTVRRVMLDFDDFFRRRPYSAVPLGSRGYLPQYDYAYRAFLLFWSTIFADSLPRTRNGQMRCSSVI